mmetsp:Transcript_17017/g.54253  ORF Transcript_17017/g.54253 Transcript_17017/m.54253 type:complete len:338 (-) Transcript_17017:3536-4549(-)
MSSWFTIWGRVSLRRGISAKEVTRGSLSMELMSWRNSVSIFLKRPCSWGSAPRPKMGSRYTHLRCTWLSAPMHSVRVASLFSQLSVFSLKGPKKGDSRRLCTRLWLSPTSVMTSFHSLMRQHLRPVWLSCLARLNRRSTPHASSWWSASRRVTSPWACACRCLTSSAFSVSFSAALRKSWSLRLSLVLASAPRVGKLSIPNSWLQWWSCQPSPRTNLRYGSALRYLLISLRRMSATGSLEVVPLTLSVHLARKSSTSYSLLRMESQSASASLAFSSLNSEKRSQLLHVPSTSAATSSRKAKSGASMEKCSQSPLSLSLFSRISASIAFMSSIFVRVT